MTWLVSTPRYACSHRDLAQAEAAQNLHTLATGAKVRDLRKSLIQIYVW